MSGFVAGFGEPDSNKVEKIFGKIRHRGPDISGISHHGKTIMCQNYLRADTVPEAGNKTAIPFCSPDDGNLKICYDGQLGSKAALAGGYGISGESFLEERLLLAMYRKHGQEMCRYLDDGIFAFVISDGTEMFIARDILGIKTLFYGTEKGTLYIASELKSLSPVIDEVYEFPAGYYMKNGCFLVPFGHLPTEPPALLKKDVEEIAEKVRNIVRKSFDSHVDFSRPTAGLLSGGMDSGVICALAAKAYRKRFRKSSKFRTFAIGVGESSDIRSARLVSEHINSEHHELLVNLAQILDVIPEVVYQLESFDPSLVRSAVSNYLVSKYAGKHGVEVLLSGEGGDEVFCGYTYLKRFSPEELVMKQIECLKFLHNNASLRLDRMNQCNSIRVVAPLISGELLKYALRIPPQYKQKPEGDDKIEKWIFRKAHEKLLPGAIMQRVKEEFSQGSGSADVLPEYFESEITGEELAEARRKYPIIRSKEELFYFRIFVERFGDGCAVKTVGQWPFL